MPGESTCRNRRGGHEGSMNNVRFTLNSRHWNPVEQCPLCAKSGHLSFHSITSSASCKIELRTERPRALAVLRLKTNSNLVGDCTGKLLGDSPLRMRST